MSRSGLLALTRLPWGGRDDPAVGDYQGGVWVAEVHGQVVVVAVLIDMVECSRFVRFSRGRVGELGSAR